MRDEITQLPSGAVIRLLAVARREEGKPGPGLILSHGRNSSSESNEARAMYFAGRGYTSIALDLRGHGLSEGYLSQLRGQDHCRDVLEAYQFLANRPTVDPNQIGFIGASYSGYLGTWLLAREPLRWLGLRAPALYRDGDMNTMFNQVMTEELQQWRCQNPHWQDISILANARRNSSNCSVLLIESEKDSSIPHSVMMTYQDAFSGAALDYQYRLMLRTGHSLTTDQQRADYLKILTEWLPKRD